MIETETIAQQALPAPPRASARSSELGGRLRSLRLAAGLTQSELAADRFSKEYVSQVERGTSHPSDETICWLATRLGADSVFLATGFSTDLCARLEAVLARAEALNEAHRHGEAAALFASARREVGATGSAELEARALSGEAWALVQAGDPRTAVELLLAARELTGSPQFSDLERAELLFRLGVCRYRLSSVVTAVALFDEALDLAAGSGLLCARLRADILCWRSRCRRRRRELEPARDDIEAAVALARDGEDRRLRAEGHLEASLAAERAGHWLAARTEAQQARALYEAIENERTAGRMMGDLGSLRFLLGQPEQAVDDLTRSFALAVEAESNADAARALGALAGVHLHLAEHAAAEGAAREALALLEACEDVLEETGRSQLVLGRSLLERGALDEAEESFLAAGAAFEQMGSVQHRAGAWVARGDLARRRGDDGEAARLYRIAAEALQDVRF